MSLTRLLRLPPPVFFIALLLSILVIEAIVMVVLHEFFGEGHPLWVYIIVDDVLLTTLFAPLLWFLFMRPVREAYESVHAQSAAIMQTAAEGIITIDAGGTIVSANRSLLTMFGYECDSVIGAHARTCRS